MKRAVLIVLLAGCVQAASAQISGGLKAGLNISNFTGGDFENLDKQALVGFHAGAYMNFRLGAISLQPEALVSTAGAKFKDADTSFRLTYITVPVMVKFRSPGGFYLEAGPQVGFKISEDVPDQTIRDFAKNLDLGIAGGLGFQSNGGFGIGARYIAGLSKVGDFEANNNIDPDFKNGVLQVGIFFGLGGK